MTTLRHHWRPAMLAGGLVAALLLAGCGGGGGDDPPRVRVPTGVRSATASAGSDVTTENYASLAAPLVRSLAGSGADDLVPLGAAREQAQAARRGVSGGLSPQQFESLVRHVVERAPQKERPAQFGPQGCAISGTMEIGFIDNGDGREGPGDVITVVANQCVMDSTLPAVSGSMSLTLNLVEVSGDTLVGMDVTVQVSNLSAAGYGTSSGTMRMWSRASGDGALVRVSYLGSETLEVDNGVTSRVVYNFDVFSRVSGGIATTEVSGGIDIGGQTYVIETVSPLIGATTPTAGAVRLKDAQGDFVQITALSDGVTFNLDFYLAANPTVPARSLPGQRWDDYEL